MSKFFIFLVLTLSSEAIFAQNTIESTIRRLDQMEKEAVLKKDTATLRNLWSQDYVNNAPSNKVVHSGKSNVDRPVINQLRYSSFERNIEYVLVKGDVAICMGNEVVVPITEKGISKPVKRRYTNIWIKENNLWRLVARHANEICQSQ